MTSTEITRTPATLYYLCWYAFFICSGLPGAFALQNAAKRRISHPFLSSLSSRKRMSLKRSRRGKCMDNFLRFARWVFSHENNLRYFKIHLKDIKGSHQSLRTFTCIYQNLLQIAWNFTWSNFSKFQACLVHPQQYSVWQYGLNEAKIWFIHNYHAEKNFQQKVLLNSTAALYLLLYWSKPFSYRTSYSIRES